MLSKNKQKYIQSLQRKKIRQKDGVFVVEGRKAIQSILDSALQITEMFAINTDADFLKQYDRQITRITEPELKTISTYNSPDDGLAIVQIPILQLNLNDIKDDLVLFLDRVNDPGNLGTIIRLADWFGVKHILMNKGTTDPFQNKCIQSTMGAIANVSLYQVEHDVLIEAQKENIPIFATKMEGDNVLVSDLPNHGILIMGNEANGISDEIFELSTHFLSIPKHESSISESLNVAMSCGIILSHFRK
ncbi:MAG: TrmH family RNA methyltransferase [Flavobacteriales bacterium]